jgi:NAD(P)-dependent dehydrogenase (short-subunit alcohol dehydrogenase family)
MADNDAGEWWMNYEVNIKGLFLVTKALLPLMLKGGEKTIVNLASIGGLGMRPGASGYQTTKFAVLRLTEFIMVDYGDRGVLAYCVHPGGVPTELARNMPKETHSSKPGLDLGS